MPRTAATKFFENSSAEPDDLAALRAELDRIDDGLYELLAHRGEVVVRCRDGHVFRTVWITGVSIKAIRLGPLRFQYCPVGQHRTFVTPVPPDLLTERERRMAAYYDDGRIP